MKKLFLLLLSCILFACNEENVDGKGKDPELNMTEYVFPGEGGSLEVYSTLGKQLQVYYAPSKDQGNRAKKEEYSIVGDWFEVIWDYKYEKVQIKVLPNETGVERVVPIDIMSYDFGCNVKYTQKNK